MSSGILDQLKFCRDKRFTGKLCATSLNGDTVNTLKGYCWNIYFYRGRLIGDSGGIHPLRRLRRQFAEQQINLPEQIENNILKSLNLNQLSFVAIGDLLVSRYLNREQAEGILVGSLIEVLFDILHYEAIFQFSNNNQLSYILENDFVKDASVPNILMKPETIWEDAMRQFQSWEANGMLKYSPHLSPQIQNIDLLQAMLPTKTFQKIVLLLEDDRTLRDLAVKIDEEIAVLTKSFLALCKRNAVALRRTIDIDLIEKRLLTDLTEVGASGFLIDESEGLRAFHKKLIIHLTENPFETSAIQNVVEQAGHVYMNLKESTQALIAFLKCSPDLIVIDNSSVDINAQDLCDRLRRTSKFRATPIVVLSKNESIIESFAETLRDGLRSNSIDYVAKPLNQQKIFSIMSKYIMPQVG